MDLHTRARKKAQRVELKAKNEAWQATDKEIESSMGNTRANSVEGYDNTKSA